MKINRYFLYMALGVVAAGFTACSDSDDYEWAPLPDGQEVYFANTLSTTYTLDAEENSFIIPVRRLDTSAAATVALTATAADDASTLIGFDIPASVSFAAGAEVANITIGYDASKIELDKTQKIQLTIAENDATPYGTSSVTINAMVTGWKQIGTGTYTYSIYYSGVSANRKFYKHVDGKRFKISPWGGGVDFIFSQNDDGTYTVQDAFTGTTNSTYGKVNVCEISDYTSRYPDVVSYREDNTFYFAVCYYVSAGSFGMNYEKFVLD
ncbi:MAG: hypothetical protein K2K76_02465 [Muribaculaceae bacterium]|nr:hypothetical protein [Muribaculaceae bacterium]